MLYICHMTLARTITVERALHEAAQQLLRVMTCDSVAIALVDEETGELRLAHHSGFTADETPKVMERFATGWLEAAERRDVVTRIDGDAAELTAPIMRDTDVIGAITITTATPAAPKRMEDTKRALSAVAAETSAAIDRAFLVRRLEQKRRLEAISEVSAGIAQELRNPLLGISSAAQLLRFRVKDDPVVERNVGRILRETERLNSMVASLLEYGKASPVRLESGDPDAVWDTVLDSHRGHLESRAQLIQRIRVATPANCSIDAKQLAQVFGNVLDNATQAAPESSDISLQSSVLSNGAWRCRLQNGGAAIPPEALPRVFDILFTTRPGAAGIGLALSRRIIEEHRGTISLESAPNAGTAVTIVLPPASA
jgi:signal transduction histidine kinase